MNIVSLRKEKAKSDITLAKERDEEAFKRIINNNKIKLYRIAKSIVKSEFDVDDVIQETIIKVWVKLNTLKNEESFSTWITSILVNECYGVLRKNKKDVSLENYDVTEEDKNVSVAHKIDVWKALDNLTEDFRIPLILYFFEEFSYEEISIILKIPKGTVKSRISRGKEKLESILSNYGRGDRDE